MAAYTEMHYGSSLAISGEPFDYIQINNFDTSAASTNFIFYDTIRLHQCDVYEGDSHRVDFLTIDAIEDYRRRGIDVFVFPGGYD